MSSRDIEMEHLPEISKFRIKKAIIFPAFYGDRDIKMGHPIFRTILKKMFLWRSLSAYFIRNIA